MDINTPADAEAYVREWTQASAKRAESMIRITSEGIERRCALNASRGHHEAQAVDMAIVAVFSAARSRLMSLL